jgi:hypothetical protein
MSGQLSEIGSSPAVYLGDRVGVVAQGGGAAAAVAEAAAVLRRSMPPARSWLAE